MFEKTFNYAVAYGLHVFAYDPQAKPANNTESGDLSPGMKKIYSKYLLERMKPNLVFAQFCEKESLAQNSGKTVEWRKFVAYKAATVLVEGVTPDPTDLKMEFVSAQIIQIGAFTPYTDFLELTHADNIVREVLDLHNEQAALTIDLQVRNELLTSANVIYAPIIAADGSETEITSRNNVTAEAKLTPDVVLQATTFLSKQNAPTVDGQYYAMVIHPSVAFDLMRNPEWIHAHQYADPESIFAGEVGRLYKMRFVQSTQAKITKDGSGGVAVYDCIALGKNAAKMCDLGSGVEVFVKQLGSAGAADPINQRATIGFKIKAFAVKIVRPTNVVRVVCGSKFSAKDADN